MGDPRPQRAPPAPRRDGRGGRPQGRRRDVAPGRGRSSASARRWRSARRAPRSRSSSARCARPSARSRGSPASAPSPTSRSGRSARARSRAPGTRRRSTRRIRAVLAQASAELGAADAPPLRRQRQGRQRGRAARRAGRRRRPRRRGLARRGRRSGRSSRRRSGSRVREPAHRHTDRHSLWHTRRPRRPTTQRCLAHPPAHGLGRDLRRPVLPARISRLFAPSRGAPCTEQERAEDPQHPLRHGSYPPRRALCPRRPPPSAR